MSCHPETYFSEAAPPSLKYIWKWQKQVLEEYMELK
jgi:hypothetical protein